MVFVMAMNHAARCGANTGLGITLIRYGFLYRKRLVEEEAGMTDPETYQYEQGPFDQYEWFSYLLLIVGWFIMLKANISFFRVRRIKALIAAGAEVYATQ